MNMGAIQEDWFKTSDVGQRVRTQYFLPSLQTSDVISLQAKLNPEHKLHFLKKHNLALRHQPS